jgi:hypothetical protein
VGGGGRGGGTQQGSCKLTPSPTLPRKRERERTEIAATNGKSSLPLIPA